MAIATDISVAVNGDIRYTGTAHGTATAGYYTVIEFHRFLQDLADDAVATGDDLLDITDDTPSDRSTDNIITLLGAYNIDDILAEHLYDGSIIQLGGATIYDGIVNFGVEGIHIDIMQNGALLSKTLLNGDFWNTIPSGFSTKGLNRNTAAGISHRFMIKVRDLGSDIDGRRLLGMNREFGFTYGEFPINKTSRGNNVLALTHSVDLNNQTPRVAVSVWTTIVNITEGYANIDVDNDGITETYYSEWNKDVYSINDFYERMKYLTARGTPEVLYGLPGDVFRGITHEIDINTNLGTFNAVEPVSWTGGTGQLLAIDNVTTGTKMWIQLLTGVPPTDGQVITGATSAASCAVNLSVIERTLKYPFIGASTGSALIGAYGVGIRGTDLTASDKVFDLTNTQKVPPAYVTFSVGGLVPGEDRVLVGPELGGVINEAQLTLASALLGGETSITVNEVIPSDTPSIGTIRVFDGNTYARVSYTSWTGSTFSGVTGAPVASIGANTYISYIDVLASASTANFTSVYNTNRSLFIRVRDGGISPIKTFETTGTLGAAGGSTTAIRTSDI